MKQGTEVADIKGFAKGFRLNLVTYILFKITYWLLGLDYLSKYEEAVIYMLLFLCVVEVFKQCEKK